MRRSAIAWAAGSALAIIVGTSPPLDAAAPGFAIQPNQGGPFSTITFTGSNFCGGATCQPVTVTFAGQEVASNIAVAPDGSFHGRFEVPVTPAGNQRVVASQPDSGISVTALFFASPNAPPASGSPAAGPTTPTTAPNGPSVTAPPGTTVPRVTGTTPTSPARTTAPSTTATTTIHTTTPAHIASAGSPTHHQGGSWLPWVIVIAVAAALLAAGLGFWYYRRRRSLPPPSAT